MTESSLIITHIYNSLGNHSGIIHNGYIFWTTDPTPEFSAIFNDPDTGDIATDYRIQVATSLSAFTTPFWDTGKTALASTTSNNSRIADISYTGTDLNPEATYYWRIKFWDQNGDEGAWSTTTATFSLGAPNNGYLQDIYMLSRKLAGPTK